MDITTVRRLGRAYFIKKRRFDSRALNLQKKGRNISFPQSYCYRVLFTPVFYESFAYRRRRRGHCNAGFEQGFNFVVRRAGVPGDYRACVPHSSAFGRGAARYECSHRFFAVFFQLCGRFLFAAAVLCLCQTVNRSLLRIIS